MFVINNILSALASVLNFAITLYMYVVIARALMSWFNPSPYNTIVRFIRNVTDPPLRFIQKYVPAFGGLDVSPIILIFALMFLKRFIVSTLLSLAVF